MTEAIRVLASVSSIPVKVIKTLPPSYKIPDPLPWAQLVGPLVAFCYRFQFATLSGKSVHAFPLAISAAVRQRFDPTDISTRAFGTLGKTVVTDPHNSKPAARCPL
ncbi:hypothetical protein [Bradyrhizobium sp. BR13661]|jgi:hypothetical protein|uniref:hypothetical protein n=1 Tax=Bradyrhizobium sp. BR13661 TaxID=2940622 RepID=UPI0024743773|nr:hypothetical protein [Bradyrhizobium sp. BR13661]MDH6263763.1 hypothetical protein [Bradyrhizobium sp. BR13661]